MEEALGQARGSAQPGHHSGGAWLEAAPTIPAPSPRSPAHTTEGLLWDLVCLGLQSSLSQHSVVKTMAASDLEGLEGKVWYGVPLS